MSRKNDDDAMVAPKSGVNSGYDGMHKTYPPVTARLLHMKPYLIRRNIFATTRCDIATVGVKIAWFWRGFGVSLLNYAA